jgi:hypothetical protein
MARRLCAAAVLLAFLTPGGSAAGQTSGRSSSSTSQSQAVQVELTNTIRARTAKVRDVVKARTVTALILADQAVVPEGSKLVGHVVRVDLPPSGAQDTALAIAFDDLQQLKHGRTLRANFSIRAAGFPPVTVHQSEFGGASDDPSSSWVPSTPTAKRLNLPPSGPRNPNSQPPSSSQAQIDYDRGDLRSVRAGTLIGMPGVTLRVDGRTGTATFRSSSRKLELKSGLQLILRVDPHTDSELK